MLFSCLWAYQSTPRRAWGLGPNAAAGSPVLISPAHAEPLPVCRRARTFACRVCHNLSYTSVQKHDARLDRLIKGPEREIVRLIIQDKNMTWTLLALRAGSIRLGMIRKY